MLECGHPDECFERADEDDARCLWCEDVADLTGRIRILRDQLHKTAITVNGGSPQLTLTEPAGLIEVHGGTLNIHSVPAVNELTCFPNRQRDPKGRTMPQSTEHGNVEPDQPREVVKVEFADGTTYTCTAVVRKRAPLRCSDGKLARQDLELWDIQEWEEQPCPN